MVEAKRREEMCLNSSSASLNKPHEGVIELLSHRDHGTPRIVSAVEVGDSSDETKTQSEEHLCSCVDAASGEHTPEAAVLH
jgi:hypothetical protein